MILGVLAVDGHGESVYHRLCLLGTRNDWNDTSTCGFLFFEERTLLEGSKTETSQ